MKRRKLDLRKARVDPQPTPGMFNNTDGVAILFVIAAFLFLAYAIATAFLA